MDGRDSRCPRRLHTWLESLHGRKAAIQEETEQNDWKNGFELRKL
ncbi:hypothetical protein GDO86_002097 [Hymenochirus boettgeri]|uniref:Uncharacterized protein n=1 Tax=Hymenochirus boettgeri TaxID=247094 RepID=A0A8T2KL47_9PIPI|nr:hypothetical protein GDO86_002097 [Hymenochirus boettgeri]